MVSRSSNSTIGRGLGNRIVSRNSCDCNTFDELFELETVVAHAVDEEHDVCAVVISIVFTSELVVFFGVNVFAVDLAAVAVVQGVSFDGRE